MCSMYVRDQCLHLNNSLNEICGVRLGSISFEKTFWSTFGWMDFQWRGGNVVSLKYYDQCFEDEWKSLGLEWYEGE